MVEHQTHNPIPFLKEKSWRTPKNKLQIMSYEQEIAMKKEISGGREFDSHHRHKPAKPL